jgi:hypothetical protein
MPTLTRWFIKSALLYLVAALLLGVLLVFRPLLNLLPVIGLLSPAYFHLFMVGWVTQMIFGVIYWMFPIITRARPRGNEQLGWATYVMLNAGLLLRVIGEPLAVVRAGSGVGWLLVISATLQWLAAVLFVVNAWPRVKERYRGE